jgi:hypothetical protein
MDIINVHQALVMTPAFIKPVHMETEIFIRVHFNKVLCYVCGPQTTGWGRVSYDSDHSGPSGKMQPAVGLFSGIRYRIYQGE